MVPAKRRAPAEASSRAAAMSDDAGMMVIIVPASPWEFVEGVTHLVDAPSGVHYGTLQSLSTRAGERHAQGQTVY